MNRVQRSNHRGKGFACSLKNLVRDRVDREGFVGIWISRTRSATSVSEISRGGVCRVEILQGWLVALTLDQRPI